MKKDITISIIKILIWLSILLYTIYLWYFKIDIIPDKIWTFDLIILIIIWLFSVFLTIAWALKICPKKPRITQILVWLWLILFANMSWIKDNPVINNYLWDILSLIWVLITILWLTKLCIYNKCQKEKETKDVEVIEV